MTNDPALRARNVALLIDADNASPDSLDPVLTVLALPLGAALGFGICALLALRFETDLFRLPLVVSARTYLYAFLTVWGIRVASQARDRFGCVLAVGCSAILFCHAVINIGMTSGVMPVVGVTLPIFSYGGSSVLTSLICAALLINVSMRRFSASRLS